MITQRKPLGLGTLSLLVLLMGLAFNFQWGKTNFMISHYLFNLINIPIYSNGTQGLHIPFVVAALFWIPAFLLAKKIVHIMAQVYLITSPDSCCSYASLDQLSPLSIGWSMVKRLKPALYIQRAGFFAAFPYKMNKLFTR